MVHNLLVESINQFIGTTAMSTRKPYQLWMPKEPTCTHTHARAHTLTAGQVTLKQTNYTPKLVKCQVIQMSNNTSIFSMLPLVHGRQPLCPYIITQLLTYVLDKEESTPDKSEPTPQVRKKII